MNYKKLLMIIITVFGLIKMAGGETVPKGDFVIFSSYTGNPLYDGILSRSETALLDTCAAAGRLVPVEYNYKMNAIEVRKGTDRNNLYRNAALYLKADIYAVLSSYSENGDYILKLNLIPLNGRYGNLKLEKTFYSRVPENLALKAARGFADLLKGESLKSDVVKVFGDGTALINSGQWHGLEARSYSTATGKLKIRNVSRYTAVAEGITFSEGGSIDFQLYPDLDGYIKKINYEIGENTVSVYGTDAVLDKKDGSVKESIQGTCIINQGASFCLPGYGSFLSLKYMGIEKGKPDYAGVFITASLTAVHIGLVPVMTDFDVNFFPWVKDGDRTNRERRLNYFLWGTLPLTFSASFFSQLAYNYNGKNMLPPQFVDRDISASLLSLIFPGGGIFYKGYRWAGWGVYLGEMSLAGCAVYENDRGKRNTMLISLGGVKAAEIILSYFIPSSYPFFNKEISSAGDVDFFAGFNAGETGGSEFKASLFLKY